MSKMTLSQLLAISEETAKSLREESQSLKSAEAELKAHLSSALTQNSALQGKLDDQLALKAQIEKLTKEVADAKSSQNYYSQLHTQISNELEQAHAVLDSVEGAPSRDYEKPDGYGKSNRNIITRLAGAFLAIAKSGGVK